MTLKSRVNDRLAGSSGSVSTPSGRPGALRRLTAWRVHGMTSGVGLLALAATLPLWVTSFWLYSATVALVYSLATLSVVVFRISSRTLSLCQASLMGIGAYCFAWLYIDEGFPLGAAGILSLGVTAGCAVIIIVPALRLKGLETMVLTLAIGMAANDIVFNAGAPFAFSPTGASLTRKPTLFSVSLTSTTTVYWFVAIVTAVVFGLLVWTVRGRTGLMWRALGGSDQGLAATGIRPTGYKVLGLALSSAIAALAGVLLLITQTSVSNTNFDVPISISLVVFTVLAGAGRIGAALPAGILVGIGAPIFQAFGAQGNLVDTIFGLVTVAAIVVNARKEMRRVR
jgi:branched-chain amino acid transport system permease protein